MDMPFRPPAPQALLIKEDGHAIHYRCYCGREVVAHSATWQAGINHCRFTGRTVAFPQADLIGRRFPRLIVTAWAGKPG